MARDSWRDSAQFGGSARGGTGRPDAFGAGGADPFAADDAESSGPIDIMAVRRDDALIDAIAGDGPIATADADEYRLASLLAEWRSDILAEPLPERPDLDQVAAAIDLALAEDALHRQRTRSKMRHLRPLVGAAAAVAFLAGGVTAFSYSAMPGDPLWKVKEVVFTQQADSTVAQVDTTTALHDVEDALARGDAESAKTRLAEAAQRTGGIRDEAERAELQNWWTRLSDELSKLTAPASVPPPAAPTTTVPTMPTIPENIVPQLPADTGIPLPQLPVPTEVPQLPTDIQLPFPLPTDLPFIPQPTTDVTIPPEILRAPAPAPETTTPVTPTTAVTPN